MKNGEIAGRITAKHNTFHMVSHVAIQIFFIMLDSETVKGLGFNREDWGIAEILTRNSDTLTEKCGFVPDSLSFNNAYNYWKQAFRQAGFNVIQAL